MIALDLLSTFSGLGLDDQQATPTLVRLTTFASELDDRDSRLATRLIELRAKRAALEAAEAEAQTELAAVEAEAENFLRAVVAVEATLMGAGMRALAREQRTLLDLEELQSD